MPKLLTHPDAIPHLELDCRRVLRADYTAIQVAADRDRHLPYTDPRGTRTRTRAEIGTDVAAAVAEYRRTAALWGVEV